MKNLKETLELIFKQRQIDIEKQKSMNEFCNKMFPKSHPPIIDGGVGLMLDIIKLQDEELEEEISYWIYEASSFYKDERGCEITYNGNTYNVHNEQEAIDFILSNYSDNV